MNSDTKQHAGLPHTAVELERVARLLRHLAEENDDDTDAGFFGEVEYWWADQLMGVVKHDGIEWFYVPTIEIKTEGGSDGE